MKKRGFTLIELLAVIVVLAIIALIATPIVMNVIKNAQKGAVERSAERYVDAVELAIATNNLENGLIADGEYNIVDGQLEGTTLDIEVSGDYPKSGTVVIKNGQVVAEGTTMTIGDYTVTINDKGSATATSTSDVVALCTAIAPTEQYIFDSDGMVMTTATVGVQATSDTPYALGSVYSCDLGDGARTFYVLGEDGDNVKLIMNENLGETVAWITQDAYETAGGTAWDTWTDNNTFGPVTANAALAERTSGWTKLSQSQITLPTYDDMNSVQRQTWIRTNLAENLSEYALGYWISTPYSGESFSAWDVQYYGSLNNDLVDSDSNYGVRPVITIPKSSLSL